MDLFYLSVFRLVSSSLAFCQIVAIHWQNAKFSLGQMENEPVKSDTQRYSQPFHKKSLDEDQGVESGDSTERGNGPVS